MRTLLCLATLTSALTLGAADLRANERAQVAAVAVQNPDQWRYRYHNNQWWYYTPQNHWMTYNNGAWNRYYAPGTGVSAGVNLGNTGIGAGVNLSTRNYYNNPYNYNRGYYGNYGNYYRGGYGNYNGGYYNRGYYGNGYYNRGYNAGGVRFNNNGSVNVGRTINGLLR